MKKILTILISLLITLTLISCESLDLDLDTLDPSINEESAEYLYFDLSDLKSGYEVGSFDPSDVTVVIGYSNDEESSTALTLDMITNESVLSEVGEHTINVSHLDLTASFTLRLTEGEAEDDELDEETPDDTVYFSPLDLEYDGPLFDESFLSMDLFKTDGDRYRGGGGAFYADGDFTCIDGDTAIFSYPSSISSKITNNTPSTRFLNFDTPETFSGGEEEWGKPASIYTCDLLNDAESIILQTDPGDYLTGNYGRLLAWIWIKLPNEDDYFLLNYMVVRQGLGEVKYLFGAGETSVTMYDGLTYTEWMYQAETLAINESLGMHSDLLDYYWDYESDEPDYSKW